MEELKNHKAHRDYHITETYEAGVELRGTEVKAIRDGEANLSDSFAKIENGQAWLYNLHIAPYEKAHRDNHEPKRTRRLLLHKAEIRKLYAETAKAGRSLVPVKAYFKNRHFKILLGLGTGKNKGDKREDIKKRDTDREIQRAMKNKP